MKHHQLLTGSLTLALWLLGGCTAPKPDELAKFQGTWVGREDGVAAGECRMSLTGNALKFQGAQPEEWYTAKFFLKPAGAPAQADVLIEDCLAPQYVGKVANAIYKFDGETLTIAANEPGVVLRPTAFDRDAPGHPRVFVFMRQ